MSAMTPLDRTLAALSHQAPDRVPVIINPTMHGAKELGLSLEAYFARAEHVIEGQIRLRARFGHDCLVPFFYSALEAEAFGMETVFSDDGPPVTGAPVLRATADIDSLRPPSMDHPRLQEALAATRGLAEHAAGEVPVLGTVISPFSLPVLLMGFEPYLVLLHEQREAFWQLMDVTTQFSIAWANAQLTAGATAIAYFDPLSGHDFTSAALFELTGFPIACEALAAIDGPVAYHLASGRIGDRLDHFARTGAVALSTNAFEPLAELKAQAAGRIALLGNLNSVEMARWSPAEAAAAVGSVLADCGTDGGFLLGDHHGEIPFQVADEVLHAIGGAAGGQRAPA